MGPGATGAGGAGRGGAGGGGAAFGAGAAGGATGGGAAFGAGGGCGGAALGAAGVAAGGAAGGAGGGGGGGGNAGVTGDAAGTDALDGIGEPGPTGILGGMIDGVSPPTFGVGASAAVSGAVVADVVEVVVSSADQLSRRRRPFDEIPVNTPGTEATALVPVIGVTGS